ncbi:MAG: Gfo/Idh/MocA family oxidoreductase [Pirellulales bacterium]|nr:Gfo/Idh/MocA family oxidoreductase [Pirellulales bacterium]
MPCERPSTACEERLETGALCLGAGSWGTTAHVPALIEHPQAELVAIQHHQPETAARIARDFDIPHGFPTAEEILVLKPLDAVVVSSIPARHYEHAAAALGRGCHVSSGVAGQRSNDRS